MRLIAESSGIEKLRKIREDFRSEIEERFEHRARPCPMCETPGACCLDQHFVNVRVSRIEAAAIMKSVETLDPGIRAEVFRRRDGIEPDAEFYACPLYQKGAGCLVHETAKPLPCIAHACYERKKDLPPDELLANRELEIDELNKLVYGRSQPIIPIHSAVRRH